MSDTIHLQNKHFKVLYSKDQLDSFVSQIVHQIKLDLSHLKPNDIAFIVVLNGSFLFASDLLKQLQSQSHVYFVKYNSYTGTTSKSIKTHLTIDEPEALKQKTLIVLEDIIDTGKTLKKIVADLKKYQPRKIKIGSLFFKPDCYQENLKIDYIGKEISHEFIVGYGMDYNQQGRLLPQVYQEI